MTSELVQASAHDLLARYRDRSLSPVEAADVVLDRIARVDPAVGAYVVVDPERTHEAARESEARWARGEPKGLLDGVPVSVKDLVLTAGWPTLRGSRTVDPAGPWTEDAPAVARLREHGAVLLGKTATPEYGHKGVTDSPVSGIARNPWDLERTPGGSSGGASAALAAGLGPLAIGTDGGGSVRIPASFAGIFGLKPTFGRVPAWPASPYGTLSHVGPMARTVEDAALLLTVIAEPDPRDWHALPFDGADYRRGPEAPLRGRKVGWSPTLGMAGAAVDPEVATLAAAAARRFEALGAVVEEVELEWPHDPGAVFRVHWCAGAALLAETLGPEKTALLEPSLRRFVEAGRALDGLAVKRAEFRRAACGLAFNRLFARFDLVLSPTMPIVAFAAGVPIPDESYAADPLRWTPFTFPVNLARNPAASVPCGFVSGGLPVGLQVIGPLYGDASVLRACRAFEADRAGESRRPPPLPGEA